MEDLIEKTLHLSCQTLNIQCRLEPLCLTWYSRQHQNSNVLFDFYFSLWKLRFKWCHCWRDCCCSSGTFLLKMTHISYLNRLSHNFHGFPIYSLPLLVQVFSNLRFFPQKDDFLIILLTPSDFLSDMYGVRFCSVHMNAKSLFCICDHLLFQPLFTQWLQSNTYKTLI